MINDVITEILDDLMNKNKNYFETGFEDLDEILNIKDGKGALITVGGRPAMGKTAFCLSILEKLMEKKRKCLFFSFDMSIQSLIERILFMNSEVSKIKARMNNLEQVDWDRLAISANKISEWDLLIDDTPCISVEKIESAIKKHKPEVVFIDYLQIIGGIKKSDRNSQIENIMINLKRISQENGIVIFVNSQLSRAVESRCDKRPLLSDLRESGAIENISDVVIFIYRKDYYAIPYDEDFCLNGETEIIVAKNKFGLTGMFYMYFNSEIIKFFSGRSKLSDLFQ